MLINGVEMGDLDIFDYEVAEKYEKALEDLRAKEEQIGKLKMSEGIKYQCEAIFDFFNTLYGVGADKKIFGNSVNLVTCFNVLGDFIEEINKQGEELQKLTKKYSPNRAKRR